MSTVSFSPHASVPVSGRRSRFAAIVAAFVAGLLALCFLVPATAGAAGPAQQVTGATLEWSGSTWLQVGTQAGPMTLSNYLSVGVSDRTEATYSVDGSNAEVRFVDSDNDETVPTWATRFDADFDSGEVQLVRLKNGTGVVDVDGTTMIEWDATFSATLMLNRVPIVFKNPKLTIDEDGNGQLVADLEGCASSQANPDECAPLPPASNVVIATFANKPVQPGVDNSIEPDYRGVEVEIPSGTTQQNRVVADWGAWPQSFVDYMIATGTSSYWYSSGSATDPKKLPLDVGLNYETSPIEPATFDDVSFDWYGSGFMQQAPFPGASNYLSAGQSDGTKATYRPFAGNVGVFLVNGATETLPTWDTRGSFTDGSAQQMVRLYNGQGELRADGSSAFSWDVTFTANFYSGMVPFTVTNPRVEVAADGTGELIGDLGGCASSPAQPDVCTPIASVDNVTISTFSGVTVVPGSTITVEPDYHGVEVDIPAGQTEQVRTGPDWGAWPQQFVDFQLATGLSSHWYSSGSGSDNVKAGLPFLIKTVGDAKPLCEAPQTGEFPDCKNPVVRKPKITKVKLLPAKRTIKAGKKLKLKVRVVNKGNKAGTVNVKLTVNRKKGVKLVKKVKVKVPAGKAAVKKVVFRTTRKAKGRYVVRAKGAGKQSKSVIKVRPAKRR